MSNIEYVPEDEWKELQDRVSLDNPLDLISRQAAIDAVHKEFDECLVWDESGQHTADEVESILYGLPSAQPEIIRCKDCKYGSPNGVYGCRLERYNFNDESVRMYGEDYCSFAERRTDEQTD